jgi:hypothetical protein
MWDTFFLYAANFLNIRIKKKLKYRSDSHAFLYISLFFHIFSLNYVTVISLNVKRKKRRKFFFG